MPANPKKADQIPVPADVADRILRWHLNPLRFYGRYESDPQKQVFTRFDIVALSEHFGRLGNGRRAPSRIGLQPLGIAFELVKGDQPADRVPSGRPSNSRSYFDLSN